jgi:hypothetical protein
MFRVLPPASPPRLSFLVSVVNRSSYFTIVVTLVLYSQSCTYTVQVDNRLSPYHMWIVRSSCRARPSASNAWVRTTPRAPRARTRCPLGHSMCFRLTSALAHPDRKFATASAADHWSRARGHTSVHSALSISALRVPRKELPQPRHRPPPLHLVSEAGSPPLVRRACGRPLKGQAPCGALAMAANAATYLMMSPTAGRVRKRTPNTPLRRRCAPRAQQAEQGT